MSYEVWNRNYWGHAKGTPLNITSTYDMALLKAEAYSRAAKMEHYVVLEKNSPAPVRFRALFLGGKAITPIDCKHCNGYPDDECPCKGAGWKPEHG